MKDKTVSNLMLQLCALLDVLEADELNKSKIIAQSVKIEKMFYDFDRQIQRKIKDEFYQLDFKALDLVAAADAAKKHLNKLQAKIQFASMKKYLVARSPISSADFNVWQNDILQSLAAITALTRMVSVFNYQALMVSILEGEDEMYKIENVFMDAIQEELKSKKELTLCSV